MNAMDRRKGLIAGYKKLGPTGLLIFWFTIAALLVGVSSCLTGATKVGQKQTHVLVSKVNEKLDNQREAEPEVIVKLASPPLVQGSDGRSHLRYSLKNNGEVKAIDIRKGHRIFSEKGDCYKYYYDTTDQYLLDLASGEESPIHVDNLENIIKKYESDTKFFKIQLIITYKKTKDENDKLYYSLVNLVLYPNYLSRPSSRYGTINEFFNECKEFNPK